MRLAAVLVVLLGAGCSSPGGSATSDGGAAQCSFACVDASIDASLAQRVGALLGVCAGPECHIMGAGHLSITGADDFSSLMDARSWEVPSLYRVKPGDPAQSYVYMKLACDGGINGACMPQNRPDPAIAQVFHDWIEAGAPTP